MRDLNIPTRNGRTAREHVNELADEAALALVAVLEDLDARTRAQTCCADPWRRLTALRIERGPWDAEERASMLWAVLVACAGYEGLDPWAAFERALREMAASGLDVGDVLHGLAAEA